MGSNPILSAKSIFDMMTITRVSGVLIEGSGFITMKDGCKKIGSLSEIPGVGKSIAQDLNNIGIYTVSDLKGKKPETLYYLSNQYAGVMQDKCLLYVFRTAVYYANGGRKADKLKWWNWKDVTGRNPQ